MAAYALYDGATAPVLGWFQPEEFGGIAYTNLYRVLTSDSITHLPLTWWYRTYIDGMIASPLGGVLVYEHNDPANMPYGTPLWKRQFAYYNHERLWWTSVDFYDEDDEFFQFGVNDGVVIGGTAGNTGIGIWGKIGGPGDVYDGPLGVEVCDINGNKTLYEIGTLPEGYEDFVINWTTFSQKYNAWIIAAKKDNDWIVARYNLDAEEWTWVVDVPKEDDLPNTVYGVAARL